jgi:hypothetical protein
MKKLLFFVAFIFLGIAAQAQNFQSVKVICYATGAKIKLFGRALTGPCGTPTSVKTKWLTVASGGVPTYYGGSCTTVLPLATASCIPLPTANVKWTECWVKYCAGGIGHLTLTATSFHLTGGCASGHSAAW